MRLRFRSPSPAMVVACVALVVALGGSAFAVTGGFVGSDGQIHGCVAKDGSLVLIKPGKKCLKGRARIAWEQRAPNHVHSADVATKAKHATTAGTATDANHATTADTVTGPAGGDLGGHYPNPTIAPSAVGPSKIDTLPGASIDGTNDQTVPSSTTTTIAFDHADWDTDRMFDAADHRLVIHTPGKYLIQATIAIDYTGRSNVIRELFIEKNGGAFALDRQDATVTPVSFDMQSSSVILPLQANDIITAAVFQNTGSDASSVAVSGVGTDAPVLQAEWLGP